jgi:hypothetical protein
MYIYWPSLPEVVSWNALFSDFYILCSLVWWLMRRVRRVRRRLANVVQIMSRILHARRYPDLVSDAITVINSLSKTLKDDVRRTLGVERPTGFRQAQRYVPEINKHMDRQRLVALLF